MKDAELKERKSSVEDMAMTIGLGYLVQVDNGKIKEIATVGQMTSIELSISSLAISSLPFALDILFCQLTDPNSQNVECSITSTKPGMATVSYTPTLRGAHQLKITVGDTEISDSPFTVYVLPSLEKRGVPINTFTRVSGPQGVAVSKSGGNIVVSECDQLGVLSRDGKKIREFGSNGSSIKQFNFPRGIVVTNDNHILVADSHNNRIQIFTMTGQFVKCMGEKGNGPFQFKYPTAITVHHPSGLVFIVDEFNHRIQVLHPNLSFSHMFGSKGSRPGQFSCPYDVACDSSGIVYVTDCDNHRVQSFSTDGQFIVSFGSKGSEPGQLDCPQCICIDSTDTVYVTDNNHRVSAFSGHGQFLKCFGKQGSGEGELHYPKGIAVDNTTGNIYVCDYSNNRVVVY